MNPTLSDQVLHLYRQMDRQTAAFQDSTGLRCPSGCGQCCDNPQVEATPLEMLPMAMELIQRGEAPVWLEQLRRVKQPSVCLSYQPDSTHPGQGHCRMYLWRPSLCRLFGFAATLDKVGRPVLASCSQHKAVMPDIVATAQAAVANRSPVPQFAAWQSQVASLDPGWGCQPMPINQALQSALEKAGLMLAYQDEPTAASQS